RTSTTGARYSRRATSPGLVSGYSSSAPRHGDPLRQNRLPQPGGPTMRKPGSHCSTLVEPPFSPHYAPSTHLSFVAVSVRRRVQQLTARAAVHMAVALSTAPEPRLVAAGWRRRGM